MVTAQNGIPWWYFYRHGGPFDGRRLESVDPGGRLWELIPPARCLGCVVYPSAEIEAPGRVRHGYGNRFMLGEPDGSARSVPGDVGGIPGGVESIPGGVDGTAVAAVASGIQLDRLPQVTAVEVRPQRVEEDHLGIGRLPEQEVRGPLLPRGPDEEVDVGHPRLGQVAGDGPLIDPVGVDPPRPGVLGDPHDRVGDLGPPAIVDAEVEGQAGVVLGEFLRDLEFVDDAAPEPRTPAHPAHPHAPRVELIPAAADDVAVEPHEEADLLGRAPPVLRGEGVGGQMRDAQLDGTGDDVEQRRLAGLVALRPGQAALVGPAPVAVHDDRHVPGDDLAGKRRGPGARGMREGHLVCRHAHHPRAKPVPLAAPLAPLPPPTRE